MTIEDRLIQLEANLDAIRTVSAVATDECADVDSMWQWASEALGHAHALTAILYQQQHRDLLRSDAPDVLSVRNGMQAQRYVNADSEAGKALAV